MTRSLSEQLVSDTIDNVSAGWRNLRNVDLEAFYGTPSSISSNEVKVRVQAVRNYRQENNLPTPPVASLAEQIAKPSSRATFLKTMQALGLELEYMPDLQDAPSADLIPQVGDPSSFAETAQTKGASLSVVDIRKKLAQIEAIKSQLATPESSRHITQEVLPIFADEDSRVRQALEQVRGYARTYLKTDV